MYQYEGSGAMSFCQVLRKSIYYISVIVTQHIKSVALLQLVTFGYMFWPLPGHHQKKKEEKPHTEFQVNLVY